MSKKIVWHKGAPPSVGWWPASVERSRQAIRWWDGKTWSYAAWRCFTANDAAERAAFKAIDADIEWSARPASWPKRSRT